MADYEALRRAEELVARYKALIGGLDETVADNRDAIEEGEEALRQAGDLSADAQAQFNSLVERLRGYRRP